MVGVMRLFALLILCAGCNAYHRGFEDGMAAERQYVARMRALGLCERPSVEPCDGGAP